MALDFNGSTDRFDGTAPGLSGYTGAMSISLWIRLDSTATNQYVYKLLSDNSLSTDFGSILWTTNGQFIRHCDSGGSANHTAASTWQTAVGTGSTWHHLCVTYDGTFNDYTTSNIYVDNSNVDKGTENINGATTESTLNGGYEIGGRSTDDNRNIDGAMAEIAFWTKELSANEIAALSAGYSPSHFTDSLAMYCPLISEAKDLVGSVTNVDGTTVADHPRIIYPSTYKVQTYPPLQPEATVPPKFYHHRHHNLAV